jgi:glycosyltransferase involved in cell wall biosynthesis
MPRILRILNRFNLGGPTYNAAYLTKYMPPEFETLLVGGEKDETEETSLFILENLGIIPIIIPQMRRSIGPIADFKAYNKIKKIIQDFKPDIVHTHAAKSGFIGRLAAYNAKVPVITHTFHGHIFHSYFNSASTILFKNLERYSAKISDGIIAISEKQKQELSEVHKICKPEKITVIPLGFDLFKFQENVQEKRKSFRENYLLDDDEIAIGIVGRLVPIKNHSLFIKALKKVLDNTKFKVRAFIVGDGESKESIKELAKSLGIDFTEFSSEKRKAPLTFTSWLKDIDWVNAGMDIIALSSLNEGTPVSLIEAQAAGKPVVTTAVGGIEDVVLTGKTALLSDKEDYETFADNLLLLTESKEKRSQMSVLGRDFVNERFLYTRLVSDMSTYYMNLLAAKSAKTLSLSIK